MTTAVTKPSAKPLTLRQQIESPAFAAQVAKALPRHLTPDRFIRVACTAIMRTPKLAQCDQVSFFNALLTLSQLGIEPDGRRAHLIPFENRKRGVTECQLIIDYKGLVELAMRSGSVANIHADVVCESDEFEYNCGEIVKHKVNFREPRGTMYAAYAICTFKDGTKKAEVMSRDEVDAIRNRSRAANAGPWVSDYNEMAKKTVFRRLSKWLPLSPELRDAVDADDAQFDAKLSTQATADFQPAPAIEVGEVQSEPVSEGEQDFAPVGTPVKTIADELGEVLTAQGVSFDDFRDWLRVSPHGKGLDVDSLGGFGELPEARAKALAADAKALHECTTKFGKKQ